MIEKQIDAIARGQASYDDVVSKSLANFTDKFKNFVAKVKTQKDLI